MSSFVEQATLKVNDQSSAAIQRINSELKKLEQTARSLKSIRVNIQINDKGISNALRNLRTFQTAARQAGSVRINPIVNTTGLTRVQQHLNRIHQQAARPLNINTQAGGAGGGGGGRGVGGRGAGGRGLRQTGIGYQLGNFSALRGAASILIGGTAYAVAANVAHTAVEGVIGSEDARMRLRQSGLSEKATDYIMAAARKNQDEFSRIPAAAIADAAVEQLNALKANNATLDQYELAMQRIAANAQTMGITFKSPKEGGEAARQLERVSQIMGQDIDNTKIRAIQNSAMRAIIATGGEIKPSEAVRALQQLGSTITKGLSPKGLTDLLLVRDEGGRQSTAQFRMAIQDLQRDSLSKKSKAAQTALGLRKKGGEVDLDVAKAAASDLVGFTEDRIVPILKKAGIDLTSAPAVGSWLSGHGFSMSGARAFADIVTQLQSGEFKRQQQAAAAVDLDPHLGDRTFRGGTERLKASMETALARAFDKSGGAFADAIAPFSVAMDKAGKAVEKSDYGTAALAMTKGVSDLMGGPAGMMLTALAGANAVKTIMDPTSTPIEKGAAMLVTAATALLTAAGAISKYFGEDPNAERDKLAHLKKLEQEGPAQLAELKKRRDEVAAKSPRSPLLPRLDAAIAAQETALRNVQADIIAAEAADAADKAAKAKAKAEEEAEMDRLRRESGLTPSATAAAPAATAGANALIMSVDALKQLQQLGASGGLAGVNSVTKLLKELGQPTSIAAREAMAKQLGYTGRGGSAEMNTFLLSALKRLATALPAEPPKVPLPPPRPPIPEPPPPPPPPPPTPPLPVPLPVTLSTAPGPYPGVTAPTTPTAPDLATLAPQLAQTSSSITVAASSLTAAGATFATVFQSGAAAIGNSGQIAAGALIGAAPGIGAAIGASAAAAISAAAANVTVNVNANVKGAPTGVSKPD